MIFHQLFHPESSTYTYLLADSKNLEAVLIDPVLEMLERDLAILKHLNLKLIFVLDTHVHADHITAADSLRQKTGARIAMSGGVPMSEVDLPLRDGQVLRVGELKIKALATPGHTKSCMCFLVGDKIFTGDTLLIHGCGRTDFQDGSSSRLYDSVNSKIFTLPEETLIYPGHDYQGKTSSTVGAEKRENPRLGGGISKEAFRKMMSQLNLSPPQRIDVALPANMKCGRLDRFSN